FSSPTVSPPDYVLVLASSQGGPWRELADEIGREEVDAAQTARALAALRAGGRLRSPHDYIQVLQGLRGKSMWHQAVHLLLEMRFRGLQLTSFIFYTALQACASPESPRGLPAGLLAEARKRGVKPKGVLYNAAIRCEADAGGWEQALGMLDEMRQHDVVPNEKVFTTVFRVCRIGCQPDVALGLLQDMKDSQLPVDTQAYAAAIDACACGDGERWETALALLEDMSTVQCPPTREALRAASSVCERAKKWQHSLALLRHAAHLGLAPDAKSYNVAISASIRAGNPSSALLLFWEMERIRVQPEVVTYNLVGELMPQKHADELRQRMRSTGEAPTVRTYNPMISTLADDMQWREAMALLGEMDQSGVAPDVHTFNRLLKGCRRGQLWEVALSLLLDMELRELAADEYSYSTAISACSGGTAWEWAIRLLFAMPSPNVVCFNAAIDACGKCGQWQWAAGLLSEMRKRGLQPDAISYNSAIDACSRAGQIDLVQYLMCEMKAQGMQPDAQTYAAAIGVGEHGFWELALVFLQDMQTAEPQQPSNGIARSSFNEAALEQVAWHRVIGICGKCGLWEKVLSLFHSTREQMMTDAGTYRIVSMALTDAGRREDAETFFADAVRQGLCPDWRILPDLIDLHDLPVEVAKLAVRMSVRELQRDQRLNIITGKGKHSLREEALIRPAVLSMLQEDPDFRVTVNDADPGRLLVRAIA
ncbi:unnamed protein product, partial [Prorocentrum cordatum]